VSSALAVLVKFLATIKTYGRDGEI
jgi:hypothetical protein